MNFLIVLLLSGKREKGDMLLAALSTKAFSQAEKIVSPLLSPRLLVRDVPGF
jgi:hypothetical protein